MSRKVKRYCYNCTKLATTKCNKMTKCLTHDFSEWSLRKNKIVIESEKGPKNPLYNSWQEAIEAAVSENADRIATIIEKETIKKINNMAQLNRKKKASDVLANLTPGTKSKSLVYSSADGKTLIMNKPKPKLSIRNMRGHLPKL